MAARDSSAILEDITVVDMTTFVTGGFATLMLANQGADVIKIERPEVGDDSRHSGPPFVEVDDYDGPGKSASRHGESPYFWTVNYDKRSVELDLKSDEGVEICRELIAEADVVVENFRPGTAERLGLGYDDLRDEHPELVYCSISAFGESGPWSDRPGYDLLIQGISGIMNVTGPDGGDPVKVGLPQTDLITAMWAAFGIVNALYRRNRTGDGERVELGMLDSTLPWLTKQAAKAFVGEEPDRMGTKDPVIAPYQSFPTADGYLNVACANQKLWKQLCEEIGCPELAADPRFETNADRVENMAALEEELSETFTERPTEEWVERLAEEAGLPVGPVYDVTEALENEQVDARDAVDSVSHPAAGDIPILEHPLNFTAAESGFDDAPPMLGEDTEAVIEELGYTRSEIREFRDKGIFSG
ncbi:CaiB/BaiF CoA transferase family protein [Natrialba asiatica]|uniref:L-carnitine dehydratase/bile acid-inducible protein F n=1 Tax=Natrialba asiatica (strain ATCC 700177 / DSM 12278 / JCM 9576 / FERM P-10747 / NBRC 102637 / 172P1) TaxID=29540 RepID=M0B6M5_NATA1|nr:CaiB/BaiF CoA-transferase family protein [Natrialba asiatica]ELZ05918.1 L-carnitine dehydratase/bile acid-inducible protein F [Natrialba asiatica DSM 12278]